MVELVSVGPSRLTNFWFFTVKQLMVYIYPGTLCIPENTMPLEKIPAILLSVIYISLTAPTPSKLKNERRVGDGLVEAQWLVGTTKASEFTVRIPKWLTSTKTGYGVYAIIELSIIIAGTMESSNWSKEVVALLLTNGKHPDCIRLTPITTFATILTVLDAAIRYWCFHEMGNFFTFHGTLLSNHKLVTTGPYHIVRHPSYTGFLSVLVGNIIWYTARRS